MGGKNGSKCDTLLQVPLLHEKTTIAGYFIRIFGIATLVLAVFFESAFASVERPNILWLVSEDNTTLLGCYGDPLARTPTLDKLAREGVLYEHCYAQPVCAPSRFTIITGTYAASYAPAQHMRAEQKVPSHVIAFPSLLKQAGYFTSNHSKTDYNAPFEMTQIWDELGDKATSFKSCVAKQPFFRIFNSFTTHESSLFAVKGKFLNFAPTDAASVRVPSYQPDTPEIRADWARYYDQIALLDQEISVKLKELEQAGLADDTIIFYFSDNGGVLPRSKRFLQASGTRVPLLVYFPPKWRHLAPAAPGSRIKEPVSLLDLAPTVLSLAGLKIPAQMEGHAFAGPDVQKNEFVFCTRDRMDERYDMSRSVMDSRWLYIHNYRPDLPYVPQLSYMFQARGYQSWARLAQEGKLTQATAQFWGEKPTEELYNMEADPDNVKNLAVDPKQQKTMERMRAALKAHTLKIVDNGFLPEGSKLEGYEASRKAGAYPLEKVFAVANQASERNPKNLPKLISALGDSSEPVRWWAAQGCTILGQKAKPAQKALLACLKDDSGAVQIAAAEALVQLGETDVALPILEQWIGQTDNPAFNLQAGNVLARMGELARPALVAMESARNATSKLKGIPSTGENYPNMILSQAIETLAGRSVSLVYPK